MGTGQETYSRTSTVKDLLLTNLPDDLTELFAILTEVENARDGESNLLAKIDVLKASIIAVTAANGSLVSANDDTTGFLNGKLIVDTQTTPTLKFTENSDGSNETLTQEMNPAYLKKIGAI